MSSSEKRTLASLQTMASRGEKIATLTAYDASFAFCAQAAGVDIILVGDSLGMVCAGQDDTLNVSIEAMCYHTRSVARGLARGGSTSALIADMPFGSYQQGNEDALRNAIALMQAGAHIVKLEGGGWTAPIVRFLTERGIVVCAHLGLTPQSVHALSGYRMQAKTPSAAELLLKQAEELAEAGAQFLVLEMIPAELAKTVTVALPRCPTIGIGAGPHTAGQVLVLHDVLGVYTRTAPKFVRNFMADGHTSIEDALRAYVRAVKDGSFPAAA